MVNYSEDLTQVFHALADPTRRAMVERLGRGPVSVSQLAEPFGMSLPAVVQHLGVLEAAGVVSTEKVGRVRTCTLESAVLRRAEAWLGEQRTGWEHRLDRLDAELSQPDKSEPHRTATPRTATPRTATPRTATPRTATPRTATPQTKESN